MHEGRCTLSLSSLHPRANNAHHLPLTVCHTTTDRPLRAQQTSPLMLAQWFVHILAPSPALSTMPTTRNTCCRRAGDPNLVMVPWLLSTPQVWRRMLGKHFLNADPGESRLLSTEAPLGPLVLQEAANEVLTLRVANVTLRAMRVTAIHEVASTNTACTSSGHVAVIRVDLHAIRVRSCRRAAPIGVALPPAPHVTRSSLARVEWDRRSIEADRRRNMLSAEPKGVFSHYQCNNCLFFVGLCSL